MDRLQMSTQLSIEKDLHKVLREYDKENPKEVRRGKSLK